MKSLRMAIAASLLSACAGYDGAGLIAGTAVEEDVIRAMGKPALTWREADGSRLLAFPQGPATHSYMVRLGADGRLQRIDNTMSREFFARIQPGMSKDQVLRTLGPSSAAGTVYFAARDELAWEWHYCDDWNQLARFYALFDGTTGLVRSSMTLREAQVGGCGEDGGCWCAH